MGAARAAHPARALDRLLPPLEQVATRRLPRARVALGLALLPATAAIAGAAILGRVAGVAEAAGIALVVVASLLRGHESL